ncbi:HD domain-containing protein [Krasilnikovia sp. M28-CT-15]|uniref:HD domain-containing protein n=1 Tax=Krasilnikovia sp. M28-CT-15 TaxID=3373540 RepID=UPI0038778E1D
MTALHHSAGIVHSARTVAGLLLADLPERWRHTAGVARQAAKVSRAASPADVDYLLAAAWLHDVGYAPSLRGFGFHPLDGARYLRAHGWPSRISSLVAHHSEALTVAEVRGLGSELAAFPRERSAASDALTFADQTVGPGGRIMSVDERLADMLRRHGPDSPNAAVHPPRAAQIRAAARRVKHRLAAEALPARYAPEAEGPLLFPVTANAVPGARSEIRAAADVSHLRTGDPDCGDRDEFADQR